MVGTYDSLGKRPSAGVRMGRPGEDEASLKYSGLRTQDAVYRTGTGITDTAIVAAQAIGTPGVQNRALVISNDAGAVIVPPATTGVVGPRKTLPNPMALAATFFPAAAPAGNHSITLRVFGTNQFMEPVQEDITLTTPAGVSVGPVQMARVFQTISAVVIVGESNTAAADLVSVTFGFSVNPTFGLPMRIRDATDVVSLIIEFVDTSVAWGLLSYLVADVLFGIANGVTISVKEQSFKINSIGGLNGGVLTDAIQKYFIINVKCRSSIGLDQGLRTGDKLQKQW